MSVRRPNAARRTLLRTCHICGREFTTTASSPYIRQIPADGKKQKTCYFCSEACKLASYKHRFDGKAEQRAAERYARRDIKEKNRLYYERHREAERARAKARYWQDPESARENMKYARRKRALIRAAETQQSAPSD